MPGYWVEKPTIGPGNRRWYFTKSIEKAAEAHARWLAYEFLGKSFDCAGTYIVTDSNGDSCEIEIVCEIREVFKAKYAVSARK